MLMMLPKPQRLNLFVAAIAVGDAIAVDAAAAADVDDDVQQRLQQPPILMMLMMLPMLPRPCQLL